MEQENSFLPIAIKIASQTIGQDLVAVQPLSANNNEKVNKEVKQENRDRKIESLINDSKYEEMKPEDHPDYNKGFNSILYYLDYKYDQK